MRKWIQMHPLMATACFYFIYIFVFFLEERLISGPYTILHCALDDMIPFSRFAVIPYALWFVWIPCSFLFLHWKGDKGAYWRMGVPLFAGLITSAVICALYPTALELRPATVPGSDLCAWATRLIYAADTSTNVCPSVHVFVAMIIALAYNRNSFIRTKWHGLLRQGMWLVTVAILLSTMMLKQHSAIDVFWGIVLALALDFLTALVWKRRDVSSRAAA